MSTTSAAKTEVSSSSKGSTLISTPPAFLSICQVPQHHTVHRGRGSHPKVGAAADRFGVRGRDGRLSILVAEQISIEGAQQARHSGGSAGVRAAPACDHPARPPRSGELLELVFDLRPGAAGVRDLEPRPGGEVARLGRTVSHQMPSGKLRQGLFPSGPWGRFGPVLEQDPGAVPAAVGAVADISVDRSPADQVGEALSGGVDPRGMPLSPISALVSGPSASALRKERRAFS